MTILAIKPAEIGKRLKTLRKKLLLGQAEVAKHGGMTVNSYSTWEQGRFKDLKVSHFYNVCKSLGTSMEEVWTGENPKEHYEKTKLKHSILLVLTVYKNFLEQMSEEELLTKIMAAYYSENKKDFIANLESVAKKRR